MPDLGNLQGVLSSPVLAHLAAFFGGLLSAANPCVLITIPLVIGYVGGYAGGNRMRAFMVTLSFVIGLSTTFTILGLVAALAGSLFGSVGWFWKYAIAAIVIIMGLHLMGVVKIPMPKARAINTKRTGLTGGFLLGLLFGIVSSPCATPVLAVILALVSKDGRVLYGTTLLFAYALGHCALMLAAGTFTGFATRFIESKSTERVSRWLQRGAGVVITCVGIYILL
jgi:cytochrome c biogenesis protein CcdA